MRAPHRGRAGAGISVVPHRGSWDPVELDGLEQVVDGGHVELYRVPGSVALDDADSGARALAVWGGHLVALLLATAAVLVVASARIRARRDRDAEPRVM